MTNSKQKRYTVIEKERGLLAIAVHGGSFVKAAKYLEEIGHPMSTDTLKGFKRNNPDRYHEVAKLAAPKIREKLAEQAEAHAMRLEEIEVALANRVMDRVEELEGDKAAQALGNVTKSKDLQIKNANLLRGMPSEIHEKRDPQEILANISRKLGFIEGTAIEVKPQELKEGDE